MKFDLHIGIDYSGAETPNSRLKGLQVFAVADGEAPVRVSPPVEPQGQKWNWNRKEVAQFLVNLGREEGTFIAGIDHAFSFPSSYLDRYALGDWDAFLTDFCTHWPTHEDHVYVDFVKEDNPRTGASSEFRLTDRWTSSAKSVFQLDGQGTVGKSSHSGIPWLAHIRQCLGQRVHFWPFDGWDVPAGKSVIAEVYPSIFRHRYPKEKRSKDEQDAYAVAQWLRRCDERNDLDRYFHPPLTEAEAQQAQREGWILGIC